ncbi:MAG TPA: amidohydrolase family protein, partial [Bacteroides graminisolvens]|nr:amidohydrolase family protein [Bacteroides graminisolvens]
MEYTIIDAHAHLWLRQDTVVDGLPVRTLENGRSFFLNEVRQMLPPFMIDGKNTAEVFLSNMDYAQVSAAVITQEYIDGIQNDYLSEVASRYPDRFLVCGMCEFRKPGFLNQAKELISKGFKAIKIPAQRLLLKDGRVMLNCEEMMQLFHLMEEHNIILSIDLADGAEQVPEM